jgi:hypothetical protein
MVCFLTGLILAVRTAKETTHDFQILKKSKLKINRNANIRIKAFKESKSYIQNRKCHTKHQSIIRSQKSKSSIIGNWQKNAPALNIEIGNARYFAFAKNNIAGSIKTMRRLGNWFQQLSI